MNCGSCYDVSLLMRNAHGVVLFGFCVMALLLVVQPRNNTLAHQSLVQATPVPATPEAAALRQLALAVGETQHELRRPPANCAF